MNDGLFTLRDCYIDSRAPLGGWAPGQYCSHCKKCGQDYMGDKRSSECANCAYGAEEKRANDLQQYLRFNLNQEIKVKLYQKGYEHLVRLDKELSERSNGFVKMHDIEYYKKRADKYGYTTMQAWTFMRDFGDVLYMGSNLYFDLDILLDNKDLKNKSQEIVEELEEMQKELYENAKKLLEKNIKKTEKKQELIKYIKEKHIVKVPLSNLTQTEELLKTQTGGAKVLFIDPENESVKNKKCIITNSKADYWVYIGKTY